MGVRDCSSFRFWKTLISPRAVVYDEWIQRAIMATVENDGRDRKDQNLLNLLTASAGSYSTSFSLVVASSYMTSDKRARCEVKSVRYVVGTETHARVVFRVCSYCVGKVERETAAVNIGRVSSSKIDPDEKTRVAR